MSNQQLRETARLYDHGARARRSRSIMGRSSKGKGKGETARGKKKGKKITKEDTGKLICGVLKLAQSTVDVTLGMDVSWWKFAFLSEADKKIVVSGPASHIFVAPRSHLCARATSANLYLRAGKRPR